MSRPKWIGRLAKRDLEAAKAEIVEALDLTGGNVRRAAHFLGIGQPWLCRLVVRLNLRGAVSEARARASRPSWLMRARRILVMDEQLEAVVEACRGMSEEEVRELIESSSNASDFEDPGLVAAYVCHLAAS